jgi:hypothetical protein
MARGWGNIARKAAGPAGYWLVSASHVRAFEISKGLESRASQTPSGRAAPRVNVRKEMGPSSARISENYPHHPLSKNR